VTTAAVNVATAGRRRYLLFDALRAIASLMVVGYHVRATTGSSGSWDAGRLLNMGVPIFFVLSGFLLYRPFLAGRLDGAKAPSISGYAKRRVLRILPAYWLALIVLGLALPAALPGIFGSHWWAFFGLDQTWVPHRTFEGLAPAWSLSVEASFYVALPFYALALRGLIGRFPRPRQIRLEFALLAAIFVVTILARRFVFDQGYGPRGFLAWSLLGHLDWFAAGIGLALASVVWEGKPNRPGVVRFVEARPTICWVASIGLFLLLGFVNANPGDIVHIMSIPIALLLVAPAVFGDDRSGLARRFLAHPVMAWLGVVSYGIFLWNEPIPPWIHRHGLDDWGIVSGYGPRFILTAGFAIAAAAISYYVVERPAIKLGSGKLRDRLPWPASPAKAPAAE
jgi:peptidoglycan/LPS O-acetylase OafA/YrhL